MSHQSASEAPVKKDRRQDLILAAFETIAERGYEGLRVRDVAFQVGINGATLHYYFPTKEVLIQSVLEYTNERLTGLTMGLEGAPLEQLKTYLHRIRLMMSTEPNLFVVLAETNMRAQHGLVLQYVLKQETTRREWLAEVLKACIEQGNLSSDMEPVSVATSIITLLEGAGMWLISSPERVDIVIKQVEQWLHIRK